MTAGSDSPDWGARAPSKQRREQARQRCRRANSSSRAFAIRSIRVAIVCCLPYLFDDAHQPGGKSGRNTSLGRGSFRIRLKRSGPGSPGTRLSVSTRTATRRNLHIGTSSIWPTDMLGACKTAAMANAVSRRGHARSTMTRCRNPTPLWSRCARLAQCNEIFALEIAVDHALSVPLPPSMAVGAATSPLDAENFLRAM